MAWTVLRTVTDSVSYVTAADHNETKANFDIVGGADGATKTGNWYVSGNVGIGTSSPTEKLSVLDGNFVISKTSYGGFLKWTQGTTSPKAGGWEWGDGTGWRMDFGPSATPQLSIYDNGNVGIGTTSPLSTLHVVKASGATLRVTTETGAGGGNSSILMGNQDSLGANKPFILRSINAGLYLGVGDSWSSETGGTLTTRMTIDTAGLVGIGTTSPAEKLHINGNVLLENNNGYYIKNNVGTTCRVGAIDASNQLIIGDGVSTSMYLNAGQNIYFHAQGAYRATIGANGLKIGDSTPPGYQLHLTTDSAAKPTSNTWTISSDARVKEIVGPYTRGVADIMALQPKRYRLNGAFGSVDDGRVHVSVIAQEAQATWPEMIGTYEHTDKDADDVETVTELLNLNTNELQWALVNAIKELAQRVEVLER